MQELKHAENVDAEPEQGISKSSWSDQDPLCIAQDATDQEHCMPLKRAVRLYPKAIGWSMLLSTAVIMEGYDLLLMGSLFAQPAFRERYGEQLANGKYQIPAYAKARNLRRMPALIPAAGVGRRASPMALPLEQLLD